MVSGLMSWEAGVDSVGANLLTVDIGGLISVIAINLHVPAIPIPHTGFISIVLVPWPGEVTYVFHDISTPPNLEKALLWFCLCKSYYTAGSL